MISARGPDSASADERGIDVRAPLLRVARQTPKTAHNHRVTLSVLLAPSEKSACLEAERHFGSTIEGPLRRFDAGDYLIKADRAYDHGD